MAIEIDLRIASQDWVSKVPALLPTCQRALQAGMDAIGSRQDACVDVLLTTDAEMQELNTKWRQKTKPTDVLSFPADGNQGPFLGDIAVGLGVASRDAAQKDKSLSAHLSHLLIHGLLHLLGHDHIEDEQAKVMEALEGAALSKIGYDNPYSQTAPN